MKKIFSLTLLISALLTFAACEKFLDVNVNEDAPDYISAELYLPGVLDAYADVYYDIRALGPLTQMMGTSGYTSFATHYYSKASDAAGQMWRMSYWEQGMNLENMINQAIEGEQWTLAGIGYAIKAFSWDCITKYHGEAPMKQAYEPGRLSHDYDYQPEIMAQVRDWAKTAIEYLEKEDENTPNLADADLVYGGDKTKWIKFAHSIIVSDLAALTRKSDFATKYAPELLEHAAKAIDVNDANFTVKRLGGGADAVYGNYNNFWGVSRGNLTNSYWQSDYIVQIMTGTVPQYDQINGERVDAAVETRRSNWELAVPQIICDTTKVSGHYDPRAAAKLATTDGQYFNKMNDLDAIKDWVFVGSGLTSVTSPNGETTPNMFGYRKAVSNKDYDGTGRWIFREDAPYILLTASEIQFELAETYWVLGKKSEALAAFKKGVALDMEFTGSYLNPGKPKEDGVDGEGNPKYVSGGALPGGSMISTAAYNTLANEYIAGPYVNGLSEADFTLSHIMMQKYVALWPWGALEAWTDLRKYNYDIKYTGDYPSNGNGWEKTMLDQKWDTDPTKVYKGFYLGPAQVEYRKSSYNADNNGSPCYRVRPRYNSEYMWNLGSLQALKPIAGDAPDYQCSKPWFVYPGDYPNE